MIRILKTEIEYLWIKLQMWYYTTAISDVDPLHPDVPMMIFKLRELKDRKTLLEYMRWKS